MISASLLHELSFDCKASLNRHVTDRLRCVPQPHCCRVGQVTEKGVEFKSDKGLDMFAFQKGLSRVISSAGLSFTVVNIDSFLKVSHP